jgi:putative SOS response-associated peptidase YedK
MCASYNPANPWQLEHRTWGARTVKLPPHSDFGETSPGQSGPMLTGCLPGEWVAGMFGIVPFWGNPKRLFRTTFNARVETVARMASFRNAWRHRQFALVPMQNFYAICYETGEPVRRRIERADGEPFAVAGIWERRTGGDGPPHWSFSLLTVNADEHPLMSQFRKPMGETRSLVMLDPADYEGWLNARTDDEARSYLRLFDPHLMVIEAEPARSQEARDC